MRAARYDAPVNVPAGVRAWARFAYQGWRDPSLAAPVEPLPALDMRRLGLAPLLHHVLHRRGDARASQFAAEHRQAAENNLRALARVARVRDLLEAHGISPVLIKGGAFLVRYAAGNVGIRAMGDLDLLVARERFDDAFRLLEADGWQRANPELKYSSRVAPAIGLTDRATGVHLDLHRELAQWPLLRSLPDGVRARSEVVGGWRVPSAMDMVLVAAVHRARHGFLLGLRDLVDLQCALDERGHRPLVGTARETGLAGCAYAAARQAGWWFAEGIQTGSDNVDALSSRLSAMRRYVLRRIAAVERPFAPAPFWQSPMARNLIVFPVVFGAPTRSLAAAAIFLPRRALERATLAGADAGRGQGAGTDPSAC